MSEETVKLDINVGGSASQDMQKLAESLDRAAKAEEAYGRAVKQAADYKAAQQKFEKDVNKELDGRNPKEQARQKSQKEQVRDEARQKLQQQQRQKQVQREMDRQSGAGLAKGVGGAAKFAGGMGGGVSGVAGALGALGPWGMAAGAALMALEVGVKKATEGVNIMNSGVHTAAQKNMMLAETLIPGIKELKELGEAVDGTTEALAKHKREVEDATKRSQVASAARSEARGFEADKMDFNRALVAAGKSRAGISATKFDRSTAVGQRRYDDYQGVQDKNDAERQASLQARASDRNMDTQAKHMRDAEKARNMAAMDFQNKMAKLRGVVAGENEGNQIGNKKGKSEAAAEAKKAQVELENRQKEYEAQRNRYAESAVKWAEAESAAKKAALEVSKAELEVMKQKEQRMAGYAQKLGGMNQGDFEMAKAALDAVKEGGIEDLPAEMADMAAKLAPDYIAKKREEFGEKRAKEVGVEFGDIDDPTVRDFKENSLKDIRKKVDEKQLEVRIALDLDAEKTAAVILDKLGPILGELKRAIDIRVDRLQDTIDLDRIMKHMGDG